MIILIAKLKLCAIEHLHKYERLRKIVAANIAQIEGLRRNGGRKSHNTIPYKTLLP